MAHESSPNARCGGADYARIIDDGGYKNTRQCSGVDTLNPLMGGSGHDYTCSKWRLLHRHIQIESRIQNVILGLSRHCLRDRFDATSEPISAGGNQSAYERFACDRTGSSRKVGHGKARRCSDSNRIGYYFNEFGNVILCPLIASALPCCIVHDLRVLPLNARLLITHSRAPFCRNRIQRWQPKLTAL